jgi:hypothetical protein
MNMSKYFIAKATGSVLEVNEKVMVGEGKNATPLYKQYESRPENYTPCDKDGKPLKAAKGNSAPKDGDEAPEGNTAKGNSAAK